MAKKTPRQKMNTRIWDLCKKWNRLANPNKCYTCGKGNLEGCNWHTGHGKSKGVLSVQFQYDTRNLKSQCMRCNKHFGGQSDIFLAKLEKEPEGLEFLNDSCVKQNDYWQVKSVPLLGGIKAMAFLEKECEKIKEKIDKLEKTKAS